MRSFWEKVRKTEGCWLWSGTKENGYGIFYKKAHRVAYELTNGPIPEGKVLRHTCDVRACVNPKHLLPGTPAENVADMDARGRRGKKDSATTSFDHRGERNPNSKLTDRQTRAIARLFAGGGYTKAFLGKAYEVTPERVGAIVRRSTLNLTTQRSPSSSENANLAIRRTKKMSRSNRSGQRPIAGICPCHGSAPHKYEPKAAEPPKRPAKKGSTGNRKPGFAVRGAVRGGRR